MIKNPEEIRIEQNLNQTDFGKIINLSRRTYNARLMEEQDWKLDELIKLCNMGNGKILIKRGSCSYVISISKID